MRYRLTGFVCFALALILSRPAAAQDVTFRFSGQVDQLFASPFGDVGIGTAVNGCYAFNPNKSDSNSDPNIGDYAQASRGFVIQIGSTAFQTNRIASDFLIEIGNDFSGQDFYHAQSMVNRLSNGEYVSQIDLTLLDYS